MRLSAVAATTCLVAFAADRAAGPGEQFGRSVLTLRREGATAGVAMDGAPHFNNCRVER